MRRKTLPAGQKRRRGRKSRLRTCAGQAPGRGAFSGGACPLPRRTPERFRANAATAGNLRRRGRLKGRPSPQRESPCSSQERLHGAVAACGKSSPHGETQEGSRPRLRRQSPRLFSRQKEGHSGASPSHLRLPGRLPSGRKRGIPTAGGNPLILFFLCFFRVRFSPALPGPHPALPRGKIP